MGITHASVSRRLSERGQLLFVLSQKASKSRAPGYLPLQSRRRSGTRGISAVQCAANQQGHRPCRPSNPIPQSFIFIPSLGQGLGTSFSSSVPDRYKPLGVLPDKNVSMGNTFAIAKLDSNNVCSLISLFNYPVTSLPTLLLLL